MAPKRKQQRRLKQKPSPSTHSEQSSSASNTPRTRPEPISTMAMDPAIKDECAKALHVGSKNIARALKLIQESLKRHGEVACIHYAESKIHARKAETIVNDKLKKKCFRDAAVSARKALALTPGSVAYASHLIKMLLELAAPGEGCQEVIQECERALQIIDPRDPALDLMINDEFRSQESKAGRVEFQKNTIRDQLRKAKRIENGEKVEVKQGQEPISRQEEDVTDSEPEQETPTLDAGSRRRGRVCRRRKKTQDNTQKIGMLSDFWKTLSANKKIELLTVKIRDLKNHVESLGDESAREGFMSAIKYVEENRRLNFWQCCFCDKAYSVQALMTSHVRNYHGKEFEAKLMIELVPEIATDKHAQDIRNGFWKPIDIFAAFEMIKKCSGSKANNDLPASDSEGKDPGNDVQAFTDINWPTADDAELEQLLEDVREHLEFLLENECLAMSHIDRLIKRAVDVLLYFFSESQIRRYGLDQTLLSMCLLDGYALEVQNKFLCQLIRSYEFIFDGEETDEPVDNHRKQVNSTVEITEDFSSLRLHESSYKRKHSVDDGESLVVSLYMDCYSTLNEICDAWEGDTEEQKWHATVLVDLLKERSRTLHRYNTLESVGEHFKKAAITEISECDEKLLASFLPSQYKGVPDNHSDQEKVRVEQSVTRNIMEKAESLSSLFNKENCIAKSIELIRVNCITDLFTLDCQILARKSLSSCGYMPLLRPLLQSFLRTRLDPLINEHAINRSEAAYQALLAEQENEAEKNSGNTGIDARKTREYSKNKKKGKKQKSSTAPRKEELRGVGEEEIVGRISGEYEKQDNESQKMPKSPEKNLECQRDPAKECVFGESKLDGDASSDNEGWTTVIYSRCRNRNFDVRQKSNPEVSAVRHLGSSTYHAGPSSGVKPLRGEKVSYRAFGETSKKSWWEKAKVQRTSSKRLVGASGSAHEVEHKGQQEVGASREIEGAPANLDEQDKGFQLKRMETIERSATSEQIERKPDKNLEFQRQSRDETRHENLTDQSNSTSTASVSKATDGTEDRPEPDCRSSGPEIQEHSGKETFRDQVSSGGAEPTDLSPSHEGQSKDEARHENFTDQSASTSRNPELDATNVSKDRPGSDSRSSRPEIQEHSGKETLGDQVSSGGSELTDLSTTHERQSKEETRQENLADQSNSMSTVSESKPMDVIEDRPGPVCRSSGLEIQEHSGKETSGDQVPVAGSEPKDLSPSHEKQSKDETRHKNLTDQSASTSRNPESDATNVSKDRPGPDCRSSGLEIQDHSGKQTSRDRFSPGRCEPTDLNPSHHQVQRCEACDCFLNSIVQVLWSMPRFRYAFVRKACSHIHVGAPCVICGLSRAFSAIEERSGSRHPTGLSIALANLHHPVYFSPDVRNLQVALAPYKDQVNHISYVLRQIFYCLHDCITHGSTGINPLICTSDGCFAGRFFGPVVSVRTKCNSCGYQSKPVKYTLGIMHLNTGTIRENKRRDITCSFHEILKLYFFQAQCDPQEGGCGNINALEYALLSAPEVFVIDLSWETKGEPPHQIREILKSIPAEVHFGLIFQGLEPGKRYFLKAMVCFSVHHHYCFSYSHRYDRWTMCHNNILTDIGRWGDLINTCAGRRIKPEVLFYHVELQE